MYCTKEDIVSDFKNITIDEESTVTSLEVEDFIKQTTSFINGRISSRYVVPVVKETSPIAFDILRQIAIYLVSDRVRHILYTKTGVDSKDQDTKGLHSFSRSPRKDLKDIQDGVLELLDAETIGSSEGFDTGCREDLTFSSRDQW